MQKLELLKMNNGSVSCVPKIPCICNINAECEKIVIILHGLGSSKESDTATTLLSYLGERRIGALAYGHPGHGESNEVMGIASSIESLRTVEGYLRQVYPDKEIMYFGSSFGAYILGLYFSKGLNSGKRAFMRCAAVIFPELIFAHLGKEKREDGMYLLDIGIEKEILFTPEYIEELKSNNLIEIFREKSKDNPNASLNNTNTAINDMKFHFIHGEKDPVVPLKAVVDFTSEHGYPLTIVKDEVHGINKYSESVQKTMELAYELFNK